MYKIHEYNHSMIHVFIWFQIYQMLFLCSWSHCLNCIRGTRARSSIWPCSGSACNTCKHSAQRNIYAHNHSACCVCCAQPGLQTIRRCAMDLFWKGHIGRHWPVLYTCISVWRSYHNIGLRDVSTIYQKILVLENAWQDPRPPCLRVCARICGKKRSQQRIQSHTWHMLIRPCSVTTRPFKAIEHKIKQTHQPQVVAGQCQKCWRQAALLASFLAESKNEFVPILDWRMPMMTIQCIILHPSYMQLRCSESWVSLCKSFPSCWVPCFTAGTSNSTQGRPWLQTCKACVSGLSLSPFMIAKQIASFAAARKPLANEAIPNASINNVHK